MINIVLLSELPVPVYQYCTVSLLVYVGDIVQVAVLYLTYFDINKQGNNWKEMHINSR